MKVFADCIGVRIYRVDCENVLKLALLYVGLLANLVGVAPEKAIKLAANDFFRGTLAGLSVKAQGNPDKLPVGLGILAGALAGITQVIATNPMEAVKIRMQMATITIGDKSSIMSVQRVPSTLEVVKDLVSFKNYFASKNQSNNLEFPYIFASGIFSGAIGAFLVTPMDGKLL